MARLCHIVQNDGGGGGGGGGGGVLVIGSLLNDAEWCQRHTVKEHHSAVYKTPLLQCCTGRPVTVFYIHRLITVGVWREFELRRNSAGLFSLRTLRPVAMVLPIGTVAALASQRGVWRGAWRAAPEIHFRVTHILRALLPYIWICMHTPT